MKKFSSLNKWKFLSLVLIIILSIGMVEPHAFAQSANNIFYMIQNIQNSVQTIQNIAHNIWSKTNNLPIDPASNSHVDAALKPLNQHSSILDQDINSGGQGFPLLIDPTPDQISNDYSFAVYSGHLTLYFEGSSVSNTTGGTDFPINVECQPVVRSYPTKYLATVDSSNPIANVDFSCQSLGIVSGGARGSVGHVWVAIEYTRLCVPNQNQAPFLICQQ